MSVVNSHPADEKLIRVGCPAHNCGGRCLLIPHVSNGRITCLDAQAIFHESTYGRAQWVASAGNSSNCHKSSDTNRAIKCDKYAHFLNRFQRRSHWQMDILCIPTLRYKYQESHFDTSNMRWKSWSFIRIVL